MIKRKREFDGNRLYKLVERIVKMVTLVALLFGLLELYVFSVDYNMNKKDEWDTKCMDYDTAVVDCQIAFWEVRGGVEKNMWYGFGVAVVLPVIFYGGSKLYNYLFPIIDDRKKVF